MPLYHKDVFMPRRIKGIVPSGVKEIRYSGHAIKESQQDRYGQLPLPTHLDFGKLELVEVLENLGKAAKIVVRHSLDETRHLCLALIPTEDRKVWFAKTVWANLASDNHDTLNPANYVCPT